MGTSPKRWKSPRDFLARCDSRPIHCLIPVSKIKPDEKIAYDYCTEIQALYFHNTSEKIQKLATK